MRPRSKELSPLRSLGTGRIEQTLSRPLSSVMCKISGCKHDSQTCFPLQRCCPYCFHVSRYNIYYDSILIFSLLPPSTSCGRMAHVSMTRSRSLPTTVSQPLCPPSRLRRGTLCPATPPPRSPRVFPISTRLPGSRRYCMLYCQSTIYPSWILIKTYIEVKGAKPT